MKTGHQSYQQFIQWVQSDMIKSREVVNRKVFSVVLWCLILPMIVSIIIYALKKYSLVSSTRYADAILFLPPFVYALYSLWPTLRAIPRVFRKGGLGAMLDESAKEVEWCETVAERMQREIKLTKKEWSIVSFHLELEITRIDQQNKYMTVLATVVLFFLFQFLDLGGTQEMTHEAGPAGMVKMWVDQFSQWGLQIFSLLLFSVLFYLSGLQFQRYLNRYFGCVKRIEAFEE